MSRLTRSTRLLALSMPRDVNRVTSPSPPLPYQPATKTIFVFRAHSSQILPLSLTMDSPPKRMTRSRAAAKAQASTSTSTSTSAGKPTRIVTAAAKARNASTATAGTKSTAAKRKTRSDDNDADDGSSSGSIARKATRTTAPRQLPETTGATSRPSSSLAQRATASSSARDANAAATRVRAPSRAASATQQPSRPASRATAAPATSKSSVRVQVPVARKSVKFQEEGKENIEPETKANGKPSSTTGTLRARPTRRAATPGAARATTSKATSASAKTQKKPLSPKKVTQMPVKEKDVAVGDNDDVAPKKSTNPNTTNDKETQAAADPGPDAIADSATSPLKGTSLHGAQFTVTIGSPPRRPPASPPKETLNSPAKRLGAVQLPGSVRRPAKFTGSDGSGRLSPSRNCFLQSPAKRPPSPIKGLVPACPTGLNPHTNTAGSTGPMLQSPAKRAFPGMKPPSEETRDASTSNATPKMQPLVASTSTGNHSGRPSDLLLADEDLKDTMEDPFRGPIATPLFTGRMSAILPRHDDALAGEEEITTDASQEDEVSLVDAPDMPEEEAIEQTEAATEQESPASDDAADFDEIMAEMEDSDAVETPTEEHVPEVHAEQQAPDPRYQLRDKDLDPCHDMTMAMESEDELSPVKQLPKSSSDIGFGSAVGRESICTLRTGSRRSTMGLSALAEQLDAWSTRSPVKDAPRNDGNPGDAQPIELAHSPHKSSFFEEELYRDENGDHVESYSQATVDALSEASQEYGDENELPVDPSLSSAALVAPVTPMQPPPTREFFTTTKVPLKPADDSTPSPAKKRSFSASKASFTKIGTLPRSATVISYSPSKGKKRNSLLTMEPPATPKSAAASDSWSSSGTPGRTPRPDLNRKLLRGAIVYVDVHTTEGADASSIFVELLNQMGAKCVKTWQWNPDSPTTTESGGSKIGITHVVFKDGGKRTMEKVRESRGIVHCVGVSWVLE